MTTAEQIIRFFSMKPLPREGGYYMETYRAAEKMTQAELPQRYSAARHYSTAILYLLTPDTSSSLHKLTSDEIYHFYLGDPVTMLQLHPNGSSEIINLGHDIINGQRVQVTVPRDTWQGAFLKKGGKFALMGTTTSPGFEFDDFESAHQDKLLQKYPDRRDLILKLTQHK